MPGVVLGRLAQYRYSDMDRVAKAALEKARELLGVDDRSAPADSKPLGDL